MTHVELELPDDVATKLRERAEKLGMSVPRYLTEIVRRDVAAGWPPQFFQDVVGGWKGAPLERPPQGGNVCVLREESPPYGGHFGPETERLL